MYTGLKKVPFLSVLTRFWLVGVKFYRSIPFVVSKRKEVIVKMSIIKEELSTTWNSKPFKNREEVTTEIRDCDRFAGISQYACFIFAALGIIGDAVNVTLGLESMSWFLLAIVAGLNAMIGHTHVVVAKHLLGIEAESKKGNIELLKQ